VAFPPPFHFGDQAGSPDSALSRRSAEALLFSMLKSGLTRSGHAVALYDQVFGETIEQYAEVTAAQPITSTTYATLTGTSLTVDVPVGGSVVVVVSGGATFEGDAADPGEIWLAIYDGTSQYSQQLTSVPLRSPVVFTGMITASCAYVVEISAQTTFALQSKLQAASPTIGAYRSHIAVTAIPQSPRFSNEPSTYTVPIRAIPAGETSAFQRANLLRSTHLPKHAQSFYRIDFGVQREGRFDAFATFDGQNQSLLAGVPFDLTKQDLRKRLREGDVVSVRVYREGSPSSLLGTTAEATLELVGRE